MNMPSRKNKIKLLFAAAFLSVCFIAIAQTADLDSSIGNAKRMSHNMNEPNAVNPAKDNIQDHERNNSSRIVSQNPIEDLGNNYNRSKYQDEKKEDISK